MEMEFENETDPIGFAEEDGKIEWPSTHCNADKFDDVARREWDPRSTAGVTTYTHIIKAGRMRQRRGTVMGGNGGVGNGNERNNVVTI